MFDLVWINVAGSELSGVHLEGTVARGKPDLLTRLVIGCGCAVTVSNSPVVVSGLKQGPVGLFPDLTSPEVGLYIGYGDVILMSGE